MEKNRRQSLTDFPNLDINQANQTAAYIARNETKDELKAKIDKTIKNYERNNPCPITPNAITDQNGQTRPEDQNTATDQHTIENEYDTFLSNIALDQAAALAQIDLTKQIEETSSLKPLPVTPPKTAPMTNGGAVVKVKTPEKQKTLEDEIPLKEAIKRIQSRIKYLEYNLSENKNNNFQVLWFQKFRKEAIIPRFIPSSRNTLMVFIPDETCFPPRSVTAVPFGFTFHYDESIKPHLELVKQQTEYMTLISYLTEGELIAYIRNDKVSTIIIPKEELLFHLRFFVIQDVKIAEGN